MQIKYKTAGSFVRQSVPPALLALQYCVNLCYTAITTVTAWLRYCMHILQSCASTWYLHMYIQCCTCIQNTLRNVLHTAEISQDAKCCLQSTCPNAPKHGVSIRSWPAQLRGSTIAPCSYVRASDRSLQDGQHIWPRTHALAAVQKIWCLGPTCSAPVCMYTVRL